MLKPSAQVYKSSIFMGHKWSIFKNSNDADISIIIFNSASLSLNKHAQIIQKIHGSLI